MCEGRHLNGLEVSFGVDQNLLPKALTGEMLELLVQ